MVNPSREKPKLTTQFRRPRRRRVWAILAALLVILGLVAYGSMVWTVSGIFTKRVVVDDGLTPELYGLDAETISLTSSDGGGLQ